jgi:hypothetical protein
MVQSLTELYRIVDVFRVLRMHRVLVELHTYYKLQHLASNRQGLGVELIFH